MKQHKIKRWEPGVEPEETPTPDPATPEDIASLPSEPVWYKDYGPLGVRQMYCEPTGNFVNVTGHKFCGPSTGSGYVGAHWYGDDD